MANAIESQSPKARNGERRVSQFPHTNAARETASSVGASPPVYEIHGPLPYDHELAAQNLEAYIDEVARKYHEKTLDAVRAGVEEINAAFSERAPLPPSSLAPTVQREQELKRILSELDEGGAVFDALRLAMREIDVAQRYVVSRYAALVQHKYLGGLSQGQEEELTALTRALDEMDEPFYEKVLATLRELRTEDI